MNWTKIMECVPNFSEGRDLQKIDEIVSPFRAKAGVKLLDYSNDEDHNRLVVTVVGEPDALKEAVIYKPQNKMFHFCKTFCSKITLVNTIQNVI